VLAVGDAEFQQKCMAKIKSISREEGKTILFVSHNIQTIRNICDRALVLEKGKMINCGDTEPVIADYLKQNRDQFLGTDYSKLNEMPGNDHIRVNRVELIPKYLNQYHVIDIRTELNIRFEFIYEVEEAGDLMVILQVFNNAGEMIFEIASANHVFQNGIIKGESAIPGNFLNDGLYYISLSFVRNSSTRLFHFESCLAFDVEDYKDSGNMYGKWAGVVRPSFPVNLIQEPL
jgi:lipopolysaccharide transport system ATP-binding protein